MRLALALAVLAASTALAYPGNLFSTPKPDTPAPVDTSSTAVNVKPTLTNFPVSQVATPSKSFADLDAFAKTVALVSSTDNKLYSFAKAATTLVPYYAGVVLGNIGGVLAAPTLVGAKVFKPWTRQPHAINWWGAPVLEKAGTAGAIVGLPLFLVSVPFLGTSILLHLTKLKFDDLFYSAEAYRDYLKYVNSEMGELYKLADGKKVEDALPELQRALKANATPKLIEATKKWIEANPDKANAERFKQLLEQANQQQLQLELTKVVDAAADNELKALHSH